MAQREGSSRTTLTELAYLRRLQKYQKRKSDYIDHQLHRLEISCEARYRMVQGAKDLQYELTESIQSGDRNRFSMLFDAFHTFRQACNEWDTQSPVPENVNNHSPDYRSGSFLDGLSPDTREILLTFLSRVSFDPFFLLDRLLGLPDFAFAALSRPYCQSLTGTSIFGNHLKQPSDRSEHESTKRFLDFSRSDVLGLLLKLIPMDDQTRVGSLSSAWGIICAGLLSYPKAGSDKFVIAVMNAHLGQLDSTARHYLDTWLLETIRDGDFILYHTDRRPFRNKGQPFSGFSTDDAQAVDDFFATAIEKLLSILKDNKLTRLIPYSVLSLAKSIVARLDPSSQQQQAAPYFLCTRWLFASYLASLITSPESYGLLLSHHVSSIVRQRILHELARRTRQIMEGVAYSWKQTTPILPDLIEKIESIVDHFRLSPLELESVPDTSDLGCNIPGSSGRYTRQITVCASEVVNAIHSLYPENSGDLYSGLHILRGSTLRSSASSISGLSLFQTMSPSEPTSPRNGRCDVVPEVGTPTGFPVP
ncbi:hypothetical protein KCU77_g15729, partial [Aureobasidium melanogenum]